MAGCIDNAEARHFIPLPQRPADRICRTCPESPLQAGDPVGRDLRGHVALFHGRHITFTAAQGDIEGFADGFAGALVVGMNVGEGVGGDVAPLQLAQDTLFVGANAGIDEHIAHQIDIDGIFGEAIQDVEIRCYLLHGILGVLLLQTREQHLRAYNAAAVLALCAFLEEPVKYRRAIGHDVGVEAPAFSRSQRFCRALIGCKSTDEDVFDIVVKQNLFQRAIKKGNTAKVGR